METLTIFKNGMILVVLLSAPPLLTAVLVGILISLLQALFQMQDQTLPFTIKLIAVCITLALTGRWVGLELIKYTQQIFDLIALTGP